MSEPDNLSVHCGFRWQVCGKTAGVDSVRRQQENSSKRHPLLANRKPISKTGDAPVMAYLIKGKRVEKIMYISSGERDLGKKYEKQAHRHQGERKRMRERYSGFLSAAGEEDHDKDYLLAAH